MIRTPGGSILHTGDFKMDQLPLDGRLTDLRAFARLGRRVDLFLTDSDQRRGARLHDSGAGDLAGDRQGLPAHRGRIIVACFSSHVHRVQQVLDAAEKAGRKVAMVGRSMIRNMGIAADLGYLKVPDGVLVDAKTTEGPAGSPHRAHLHRVPGRTHGSPVADGQR